MSCLFQFAYPTYPLLPFLMIEHPKGDKYDWEKYFGYNLSSGQIFIEDAFAVLRRRFGYLQRFMDINIRELPT